MGKKNSESLKILKENLEAVIESSYDGIYITDEKANTLMINKAYERIAGLEREEMLGENMRELEEKGFFSESATLRVLKNKKVTTIMQKFKTGKKALVTATPVLDENDKIILVVTNVRDVTELKSLKGELEEKKELAAKYYQEIKAMRMQLIESKDLIAEDKVMLDMLRKAKRVARVNTTVLITGETGVGKEEVAKFIHKNSHRAENQFIKIDCGAIPESLIESELFGYEKGAFTNANTKGKMGLFEVADGGTVFLDEIGELPINMQVKLLRVLQENEVKRIGSVEMKKIDVRMIAATNRDLEEMVKNNEFREDLYYRLNVIPILIPPLRSRRHDIIALSNYFLTDFNLKHGVEKYIDAKVIDFLFDYDWPGNIRELKNVIERLVIMSVDDMITTEDLPRHIIKDSQLDPVLEFQNMKLGEAVAKLEYEMIIKAYEEMENVRDAAKKLGIDPATFVRKRKKYKEKLLQK